MEKRIDLEKRGRPAEEIVELNLDNCRATQIEGLTDDFTSLESLSLINVGLTTLKGFPNLPNLRKLELSDNRISGSLNLLNGCPKLTYLNLSGNKIKDIDTLEPLKEFNELRNLDLFNCEVTSNDSYREKVFELLTSLQYLDGYDRNNMEADDEDEDGDDIDDIDGEDEDGEDEDGDDDDDDDDNDDEVVDIDDDDDDDDLDEDDDDQDDEDDEDGEVNLSYLNKEDLENDEDGDDFEPGDDDDDDDLPDDDDEDDEDDDGESRGVKRKHDDEDSKDDA